MQTSAIPTRLPRAPWNKGKLVGQKPPLKLAEIWTVRTRLQMARKTRDLALFDLAIDSKLRGCDLVSLRVRDIARGDHVLARASIVQHKTHSPVRFELTEQTRDALRAWIEQACLSPADYLFPSRQSASAHLSTRQYARLVKQWIALMGEDPAEYGTHSLRRTKATLIYRKTKNLRAVQLLLGHRKIESTVRYLGIEVDDALEMAEHIEC
jgi:integrase